MLMLTKVSSMTRREWILAAGAAIDPSVVRLRLRHSWTTVMSSSDYRDNLHLRYSRDGVTGLGEAAPIVRYKEDAASARRTVEACALSSSPPTPGTSRS